LSIKASDELRKLDSAQVESYAEGIEKIAEIAAGNKEIEYTPSAMQRHAARLIFSKNPQIAADMLKKCMTSLSSIPRRFLKTWTKCESRLTIYIPDDLFGCGSIGIQSILQVPTLRIPISL
jgi:hypothetical protein